MNEPLMSNINVSLEIPANKYYGKVMHIFEQYTPIVEEALKEAEHKLLFDKDFQQYIKNKILDKIEDAMREGIKKAADNVVTDAYIHYYRELENTVRDAIIDKIKVEKSINT